LPKPKPTEIIRHEIVLGRAEKEMIGGAIAAYQFNRVAEPSVDLMKDVTGMLSFAAILTILFPDIVLPAVGAGTDEIIDSIKNGINAGREKAAAEAAAGGDTPLDEAGGGLDLLGRLWYNLTIPGIMNTWDTSAKDPTGIEEWLFATRDDVNRGFENIE
jgi:hypothetical protein